MKIALIADGRSPTTRSWIQGVAGKDYEIDLISTYPCQPIAGIHATHELPVAFSGVGKSKKGQSKTTSKNARSRLIQTSRLALLSLRYYLGPLNVMQTRKRYVDLIKQIHPDLVHALRIPFEGMLAAYTPKNIPLILSTWGNDFTLHAHGSWLMSNLTRKAVKRTDGFIADCLRDIRLAHDWGLDMTAPTLFAPGNGGLDLDMIGRIISENKMLIDQRDQNAWVINPRGIRPAYVMNDIFFKAIPIVLEVFPQAKFFCSAMKGQEDAEKWLDRLNIRQAVILFGNEPQEQLWQHFCQCPVLVSPAIHDGTPNSVLEGMAFGCLPVVGNIESLREWIKDGENGVLVDPNDPEDVASGIIHALKDQVLREDARSINTRSVQYKADRNHVMNNVDRFYLEVIGQS
jgi:glycosyltransferase involved in cell wall biosynthesis